MDGTGLSDIGSAERWRYSPEVSAQLARQQVALLGLARSHWELERGLDEPFRRITETAARVLHVQRVSIWFYEDERRRIHCADLYESATNTHSSGQILAALDYPNYFAALESSRFVVADDARHDPRTCEFRETYLVPLGITSMLDAPILHDGEVIGVVCHEHVGVQRTWYLEEQSFAASIADFVQLALERWERTSIERERAELLDDLKEAIRARDDFFSIASHELRTPLTTLGFQIELLERALASESDPARAQSIMSDLKREMQRMSRLIGNLLDVSRIRAGRLHLELESLDLSAVVEHTVERMRPEIEAAGCELTFVCSADATSGTWDRLRIEQVITNLLGNAIKFCRNNPIEVRVGGADGNAWFSIRDHGPGLPEKDRERIFRPFEQRRTSRDHGGLGLGLWIVNQIVSALRGRIDVFSRPNDGATFTIHLPRSAEENENL